MTSKIRKLAEELVTSSLVESQSATILKHGGGHVVVRDNQHDNEHHVLDQDGSWTPLSSIPSDESEGVIHSSEETARKVARRHKINIK